MGFPKQEYWSGLPFPSPGGSSQSESEVAQSCLTLCDPMDCSLPGSSVHGIFQATVLEWIAISLCRGSSQPRDRTWVSCILDRRFTVWATREVPGSSVHGVFQALVLEWIAISFSRGSSQTRDHTGVSCVAGRFFTTEPLGKPLDMDYVPINKGLLCWLRW